MPDNVAAYNGRESSELSLVKQVADIRTPFILQCGVRPLPVKQNAAEVCDAPILGKLPVQANEICSWLGRVNRSFVPFWIDHLPVFVPEVNRNLQVFSDQRCVVTLIDVKG